MGCRGLIPHVDVPSLIIPNQSAHPNSLLGKPLVGSQPPCFIYETPAPLWAPLSFFDDIEEDDKSLATLFSTTETEFLIEALFDIGIRVNFVKKRKKRSYVGTRRRLVQKMARITEELEFEATSASFIPELNQYFDQFEDIDLYRIFQSTAQALQDSVDARALGMLESIAVNIGLWFATSTWKGRILVFYNFLKDIQSVVQREYLIALVTNLVSRGPSYGRNKHADEAGLPQWIPTSSMGDVANLLSQAADHIDGVVNSSSMIALNKVFAMAIGLQMLGPEVPAHLITLGMTSMKDVNEFNKISGPQRTVQFLRSVAVLIKTMTGEIGKDGHYNCLTDYDWLACAQWLKDHEKLRVQPGSPDLPGHVCDQLWRENLNQAVKQYTKVISKDLALRQVMASLNRDIMEMHTKARCADYAHKPQPFNIGLRSGPGVGKTTVIAPTLARTALKGMQVRLQHEALPKFIKNYCVSVNASDKFMSPYKTEKHLVVFLDELGSARAEMDNDNQIMQNITSLIGESEYYINRADISDKGKDLYKPFVNVLMTNHLTNFGVGDYINNIDAFARRIHAYIRVDIKDEFRYDMVDGKRPEGVDPCKLPDDGDRMQACTFSVYRSSSTNVEGNCVLSEVDFATANDYILELAQKHSSKKDMLGTTHDYLDQAFCPHGYMNKSRCPECSQVSAFVPTSAVVNLTRASDHYTYVQRIGNVLLDLYPLFFFLLMTFFCWFSGFFTEYQGRLHKYYKKRTRIAFQALQDAKTVTERVEAILDRYEKARRELLNFKTYGTYAVIMAVVAGVSFASYQSVKKPAKVQGPPVMVGTADIAALQGEKPKGDIRPNVWDVDDGFIQPGKKACSPHDTALKRVSRNTIKVSIHSSEIEQICTTHLTGLCDQYAVGVWHSLKLFQHKDATLSVLHYNTSEEKTTVSKKFTMRGGPRNVVRIGPDLAIVRLSDVSAFKDIREHIPEKAQYTGSGANLRSGYNTYIQNGAPYAKRQIGFQGINQQVTYPDGFGGTVSPFCFVGEHPDVHHGHCGSSLMAKFGANLHLCGINVCASFASGLAAFHVIDQCMVREGIQQLQKMTKIYVAKSAVGYDESPQFAATMNAVRQPNRRDHAYWLPQDERGTLRNYGSIEVSGVKRTSSVIEYPQKEELFEQLPSEYHHDLIRPRFDGRIKDDGNYVSPERNALSDLKQQVTGVDSDILELAVQDFTDKLCTIKSFEESDRLWDLDTCINGVPGTEAKPMPKSTSAGFPDGGKKYEHLVPDPESSKPEGWKLTPELQQQYDEMLERASDGQRNGIVFKTCPKDEPRAREKVAERKIRLFTLGPMCFYLLCRQAFGAWMTIYTRNFNVSETSGGVNPFSKDWGLIYKRLAKHPRLANGDFSKYDKYLSIQMLMAAFTVIINVKERSGEVSTEYKNMMLSVASDIANPLVLMDTCLLEICGSLSSGVLLTFILNDIVNSLYIRMAYFTNYRAVHGTLNGVRESFRDNVEFCSLGDDNTYSFSTEVEPWFNFQTVQKYFASIGLKYTPADKSDTTYRSVPVSEATIGKRRWVFDSETDLWLCPIEKPSVMKTLTIGIESKELTRQEHDEACLESAVIELSQYGRQEFDKVVLVLKGVFPEFKFHTYDYYITKQMDSSEGITPWIPKAYKLECDDFVPTSHFSTHID